MTSDAHLPPEPPPVDVPAHSGGSSDAPQPKSAVKFTRTAAAWWSLIFGLLILVLLLIFIGQNTDSTTVHFLGWHWNTPVAVAILVSAVCGAGIAVLTGAARMFQLRRAAKKNLRGGR
ncbi:MAG: LapA family protein [Candidatus Sericytochromatia bacterium]